MAGEEAAAECELRNWSRLALDQMALAGVGSSRLESAKLAQMKDKAPNFSQLFPQKLSTAPLASWSALAASQLEFSLQKLQFEQL